jgi:hypothetical protein
MVAYYPSPDRGPAKPELPETQWIVTFGGDHVLRSGRVQLAAPELGGLPLGKFCAVILADTAAQARARVIEIFGAGNWCDIYPADKGGEITRRYRLQPLFSVPASLAIGEVQLCGCREPQHPHGLSWHTSREG